MNNSHESHGKYGVIQQGDSFRIVFGMVGNFNFGGLGGVKKFV